MQNFSALCRKTTRLAHTHQLDAAKAPHSQRDGVSLMAAVLVQHGHQVLEPQGGSGADGHTHTHTHSLSSFPRGDNQCTFCCDVCRVTDLDFTCGVASCITLELEDTQTESGELRMEQESEDYCQRRQFFQCTYSSKSSRCSMGMVSSNTLKRK